jgi:hypothetical protein
MIKQSHIVLGIMAFTLIVLSIMRNPYSNIEEFTSATHKTKTKIRHIHRNIRKKTNELYNNTSISINRAMRKMGI